MSQEEAVAVLRARYQIDGAYSEGLTKQGHAWSRLHIGGDLYEELPPPKDVVLCVLTIMDDYDRVIKVALGEGGIVADKQLSPGVLQYRLQAAYRALEDAASDLTSESWWREQCRKASRSLHHRRRYALPSLAAILVMVSVWVLWRRIARHGLNRGEPAPAPDRPRD
jgi:hypothetical protein